MNAIPELPNAELERTAHRHVRARLGWYIHATVFTAVNTMLALIAFSHGRSWAIYPAMGWSIGLAIHGVVVFLRTHGAGLHERLLQSERSRLQPQRDSW
jgi:2TM domain